MQFYDGTIVRKRGVKQLSVDGAKTMPPPLQLSELMASPVPEETARGAQTPTTVSASAREPRSTMRRSPSMPVAFMARGPPPPLPSFPASWKPDAPLRPVSAGATCGGAGESPALRPKPKTLREREPTALELDLGHAAGEPQPQDDQDDHAVFLSAFSTAAMEKRQSEQGRGVLRRSPSMPLPTRPPMGVSAKDRPMPRASPFPMSSASPAGSDDDGGSEDEQRNDGSLASTTCSSFASGDRRAKLGPCSAATDGRCGQTNSDDFGGRLRVEHPAMVAAA